MREIPASSESDTPVFATRIGAATQAANTLPEDELTPAQAYQYVHDQLMFDGSSRLNLATFVTTWMEPQARTLMAEAFDKNAVDHDEYPATSAIESRCIAMVADLFSAPGLDPDNAESATGVSTIGSSEAVMLAGLALKWRWRLRRQQEGKDTSRPNLVLGTNVQVVWEKFCRYFDVEPKYLPVRPGQYCIAPEQVAGAVDENTIGAVAILGTTFTGEYEDVAGICAALDTVAAHGGPDVPVHVDAASGGFVAPFLEPDLVWDFRLPRVASINASGHKYGLTYPGIGFAVWRDRAALPPELIFHVNYLGGDMPTFTLNFSRPGNQIVGQYYNFLRLGRAGYTQIMSALRETTRWLAHEIDGRERLELIRGGEALPVIAFGVTESASFDAYELSHELRARGWQVPAYSMPADAESVVVLRIVVREGLSGELAQHFVADLDAAIEYLDGKRAPRGGFAHK